jgi:hypothetical protein
MTNDELDGTLQVPSGQKLWHLVPDKLRHRDIYLSLISWFTLHAFLSFILLR